MARLLLLLAASALAQPPAVRLQAVLPRDTDPAIDSALSGHRVALAPSGPLRQRLFLFLHGGGGSAQGTGEIVTTAAEQGFHAVSITYPMGVLPSQFCTGPAGPCQEGFRREILEGADFSPHIAVSRANSVENRVLKLLRHMDSLYPAENWTQFDSAGSPRWSRITAYGHSMGAANVALIAKLHRLERACLSGPATDISGWWSSPATPAGDIYGFSHAQDPMYNGQQAVWNAMGLSGPLTDVGTSVPPYGGSHRLLASALPGGTGTDFHNSPTMDPSTPRDHGGTPVYKVDP